MVNEEELAPVFAEHGFDIIQPELMSVVEQVGLFAQAQAIVSPSSAALINLLFTNTSVRTLQILEPRWAAGESLRRLVVCRHARFTTLVHDRRDR